MRWLAAPFLIVLSGCGTAPDLDSARIFEKANGEYEKQEYLRAAALYESVLENAGPGGAVLYNLGNAYLQAGRRGHAIAAYRRAMRYRPRDPLLEANLQVALAPLGTGASDSRSLMDHVFFWQGWISYPEKALLFSTAATATFLVAIFGVFLVRQRTALRRTSWVCLVLTALAAASLARDWHKVERVRHGVVAAPDVTARKGNAESYAPAFTEPLREGTEFTVVEERPGWVHVRLKGGLWGWLPSDQSVLY